MIGSLCSNESSTFDKDTRDRLFLLATARFSVGTSKNALPNPGSPQQGLSIVLGPHLYALNPEVVSHRCGKGCNGAGDFPDLSQTAAGVKPKVLELGFRIYRKFQGFGLKDSGPMHIAVSGGLSNAIPHLKKLPRKQQHDMVIYIGAVNCINTTTRLSFTLFQTRFNSLGFSVARLRYENPSASGTPEGSTFFAKLSTWSDAEWKVF